MKSWLSHTLTAAASLVVGTFFPFLLKWKVSTSGTYELMLTRISTRQEAIEKELGEVRKNHLDCEKKHAKLEGKIEALERVNINRP